VPVARWFFLTPRGSDVRRGRVDLFLAGLIFFPLTLIRLIWKIAREKPDVVNLHFVGAPALFVLIARWLIRFRFIVSLHGDDVDGLSRGTRFDRWVFRQTLRRADGVTACSGYLLNQAQTIEPTIANKARVIYNGIDLPTGDLPRATMGGILAVGRLELSKGFDVLIRAMAELQKKGCRARLTLIGDGSERASLENMAIATRLANVEFRGQESQVLVYRAIETSRLVVIPSRRDSFGLVALETMALGKPIVATRVGGLPKVLQNADALFVAPDDPVSLACAIEAAMTKLEREPNWGARNRELAARFSLEEMVTGYLHLYLDEKAQ
jgi:glycosyltransferase involved in cell wall biosynthesis